MGMMNKSRVKPWKLSVPGLPMLAHEECVDNLGNEAHIHGAIPGVRPHLGSAQHAVAVAQGFAPGV